MPVDAPLYPVNLIVAGRPVLVVGGGPVAVQKVAELVRCDAVVTVVAPDIVDGLRSDGRIRCELRPYRSGEVADYRFGVAATGDPAVNQAVFDDGEAAGVWINAADDPDRCSVTLPSRVRQGDILVAIATGGRSPALATWLRRRLSEELGPEYQTLLEVLSTEREERRRRGEPTEGLDWQGALDSGMLDLVRQGRTDEAEELLKACLSSPSG